MLYIAYGSNINTEQMETRCPKALLYGKGVIHGWRLAFHGNDGNAYATLEKDASSDVPVVLYELSDEDFKIMDKYEGYPTSYTKRKIAVYVRKKKRFGVVYLMNESRPVARPARRYVNTIRRGYERFNLSMKYLNEALRKNSEDFYNADLLEVREVRKIKTSVKPNKLVWKKKYTKTTSNKKSANKNIIASSYTKSTIHDDWSDVPEDLGRYMATHTADSYWEDYYGSKKSPSLDDYDAIFAEREMYGRL